MKNYFQKVIFYCSILISFSGCMTLKPDSGRVSSPDYNERVEIKDAHFRKKLNPLGITITVAAPVIGAGAGYMLAPIKYQSGEQTKSLTPANMALGALVSYTTCALINKSMGLNKEVSCDNSDKWLKKVQKDYLIVRSNSSSDFTVMPKAIEGTYSVKSIEDVIDFHHAFPNSNNANISRIIQQGNINLKHKDLASLIKMYPSHQDIIKTKEKLMESCSSYRELLNTQEKYPEVEIDIQFYLAKLVTNPDELLDYYKRYPASNSLDIAVMSSFSSKHTKAESEKLVNLLGKNYTDINPNRLQSNNTTDSQKENYWMMKWEMFNSQNQISSIKMINFVQENINITFNGRANWLLNKYFEITNRELASGDEVLYRIRKLSSSGVFSQWGINDYMISKYIEDILKAEINKIALNAMPLMEAKNPEWEKWKNSKYTAGIVKDDGHLIYLFYGRLTNYSKFSLPVNVKTTGELFKNQSGSLVGIQDLAISIGSIMGQYDSQTAEKAKKSLNHKFVGSYSVDYYAGYIKAGETLPFANLFDFGTNTKMGVNYADFIKYASEYKFENVKPEVRYETAPIPGDYVEHQKKALSYAKNGLPEGLLYDSYNREYVSDAVWNERHRILLEELERIRQENESRKNNALATGDYWDIRKEYKTEEYECNGSKYEYKITNIKCKCYNTNSYDVYYWDKGCGYDTGYYSSLSFQSDDYLGETYEDFLKTLIKRCGCK